MTKKKNKFESQFSIYKVDYSNSVKYLKEEYDINVNNYSELQNHILNSIKNVINGKYNSDISNIDYIGFKGLVFKTHHYPSWNSIIKNMLDEDFDVSNTHISYILSYLTNNSIYLLTGGLGSNYISEYTEKNYGLYLLPKIIKEDSPVIKTVVENNLSGNKLSVKHSNRNVTTINTENEMSLIFRELTLALNSEMSKLLGIEIEDNNKKIINVSAKDSLVIRKSITIDNLKKIIDGLSEIEKREDSFSLGYFVDIKKNGYFSKDINNIMINDFINYITKINSNILYLTLFTPLYIFQILTLYSYLKFLRTYDTTSKEDIPVVDINLKPKTSIKNRWDNFVTIWLDNDFYEKYKDSQGLKGIRKEIKHNDRI